MRVERVGVDRVKARLDALKQATETRKSAPPKPPAIKEYEDRLAEQDEEAARAKQHRKDQRKAAAQAAKGDGDEEEEEGLDPEMAAMMGFGGFK
jgi:U4/U6.U5 tri-snRNP component SNU23